MRTIEVTQSGQTFRMTVESVMFVETCPYAGRAGEHEFTTPDYRKKFCCDNHGIMFHTAKRPIPQAHPLTFAATSPRR